MIFKKIICCLFRNHTKSTNTLCVKCRIAANGTCSYHCALKISSWFVGYDSSWSCRWLPVFQRNVSPPFSGWTNFTVQYEFVCVFLCCVVLCRWRPCDVLITRPRRPAKCLKSMWCADHPSKESCQMSKTIYNFRSISESKQAMRPNP
jgi:hypothetical protein